MISVTPCNPEKITVALLYGGKSSERDISINSGKSVATGLRDCGFNVVEFDTGEPHYIDKLEDLNPDVVFSCLHGKGGEDGCVQGVCEELGLPYTGSGVLASALAMDKAKAKVIYKAFGVATSPSIDVSAGENPSYSQVSEKLGDKVVIKPSCEGSAIGVSIVDNEDSYNKALEEAEKLDSSVVIEKFITGTEITVAVMGNDDLMALPVIEIVPHSDFYDFEAKYSQGGADHICPARLSDEITKKSQDAAIRAHKALGCRGVSRSDFIIDEDGNPWILETNTIPGMTSTSLIPDAARAMGIEFPALCKMIVELGLESAKGE